VTILAAVHLAALTGPEQRVLGCLLEKRWTTPDQYPLSLNALRLACNQATNRDPVTDYEEATVRDAAQRLARYGLTRLASGHQSRAIKYRHLAEEGLGLDRAQLAVLCVLMLRGAQTPGELKSRSERLSPTTLAEVEQRLTELIERGYVRRLGRRPGQKEDRFQQLLGGDEEPAPDGSEWAAGTGRDAAAGTERDVAAGPEPQAQRARPSVGLSGQDVSDARVIALEARVAALEEAVHALRSELSALRAELS
jgi:uncharacterized protein YceH (UPF0502 family)